LPPETCFGPHKTVLLPPRVLCSLQNGAFPHRWCLICSP
jgi:hypothetical protein